MSSCIGGSDQTGQGQDAKSTISRPGTHLEHFSRDLFFAPFIYILDKFFIPQNLPNSFKTSQISGHFYRLLLV